MIWVEPYDIEPGNQRDVLYIKGKWAIEVADYYNKKIIEDLLFNRERNMTRAEECALKAYPDGEVYVFGDAGSVCRIAMKKGYEQAEKDLINRIRKQVKTWMPEKDGEEYTDGKRLAFRSVLQLLKGFEDEK